MASRVEALKGKFTQIKQPSRDPVADTATVEKTVKDIIANVRERGDVACANTLLPSTRLTSPTLKSQKNRS